MDFERHFKVHSLVSVRPKASYLVKWPISTRSFMWWCCGSIINIFIAYLRKCNSVACKLLKIRGTAWTAYHQRQTALVGSQELSKMS